MRFRPRRWPGVLSGAGFALLLLTTDVWLALRIARRMPDLISLLFGLLCLLTVPLLAALGYSLYGLLTLTYDVNRDRVLIRWAASEQVVPMGRITRIVEGSQLGRPVRWRGIRWPGYMIGRGEPAGASARPFLSFATGSLSRQLLLVTPSLGYGISPLDRQGFLSALALRRQMGTLEDLAQEARHPQCLGWSFWRDWILWCLALTSALANGAQLAYLCWRYASLPLMLPLHFDPLGQVDRTGTRAELFRLPLIGLLVLVANGIFSGVAHSRQRAASRLLLGGTLLVQALLGLGLWRLIQ
jgi:hypothetical protein